MTRQVSYDGFSGPILRNRNITSNLLTTN